MVAYFRRMQLLKTNMSMQERGAEEKGVKDVFQT